ncbi:MAG: hypothetical protein ACRDPW_05900 [Mycobacteriales bacterium]
MSAPAQNILQLAIAAGLVPVVVFELGGTAKAFELVAQLGQSMGKATTETDDSVELRFYRHPCDFVVRAAKPWAAS